MNNNRNDGKKREINPSNLSNELIKTYNENNPILSVVYDNDFDETVANEIINERERVTGILIDEMNKMRALKRGRERIVKCSENYHALKNANYTTSRTKKSLENKINATTRQYNKLYRKFKYKIERNLSRAACQGRRIGLASAYEKLALSKKQQGEKISSIYFTAVAKTLKFQNKAIKFCNKIRVPFDSVYKFVTYDHPKKSKPKQK